MHRVGSPAPVARSELQQGASSTNLAALAAAVLQQNHVGSPGPCCRSTSVAPCAATGVQQGASSVILAPARCQQRLMQPRLSRTGRVGALLQAMRALPSLVQGDSATAAGSSALRQPASLVSAAYLVMMTMRTLLLHTACRARHADGPPSVYPFELTVTSPWEYENECIWKLPGYAPGYLPGYLPGYQERLTSMEADLHMQRLGYKWQLPPRSIWCSDNKAYCIRE